MRNEAHSPAMKNNDLVQQKEGESLSRLFHLDALRGLAALSVAVGHAVGIYPVFESWSPILGRPAVTFFFLLSGYVLGKSVSGSDSKRLIDWLCYCLRRVFRLYPAIFVTLVVAAILAKFYVIPGQDQDLSSWFSKSLRKATTIHGPHDYLGSFRLYYLRLDPPLWTIQIEFVCSFILPFIIWPFQKKVLLRWGIFGLLCFIRFAHPEWIGMASYLFEFYLGYLAWTLSPIVAEISDKNSKYLTLLIFFGTMIWMCFCDHSGTGLISVVGMAVFLTLVGPCRWSALRTGLKIPPLQFLGRISYSLYLIHLPVLMICWSVIVGRWKAMNTCGLQVIILTVPMLLISLTLGDVMERFVERPFNEYGHRISRRIKEYISSVGMS
jgi:peptidoglycan/LPS O-acetylase OafA/YrhL